MWPKKRIQQSQALRGASNMFEKMPSPRVVQSSFFAAPSHTSCWHPTNQGWLQRWWMLTPKQLNALWPIEIIISSTKLCQDRSRLSFIQHMFLFKAVEVLKRMNNASEITFDFFLVVILVASVLLVPRVSASGQWPKSPGATAPYTKVDFYTDYQQLRNMAWQWKIIFGIWKAFSVARQSSCAVMKFQVSCSTWIPGQI